MLQNQSGKTIALQGYHTGSQSLSSWLLPCLSAGFREVSAFPVPSCWDLSLPGFFLYPGSIHALQKTA